MAEKTSKEKALDLYHQANELAKKGQYKEAAGVYQESLMTNPKLADAYVGMAATFGAFSKWDRAILLLKDALKHKEHFVQAFNLKQAHYNLAVAYCYSGQNELAYEELATVKKMRHPYKRHLKKMLKKQCPRTS